MFNDCADTPRPFHLVIGRDLLTGDQEAYEVGTGNGLNLMSQAIECIAMYLRQQAARAPLGFGAAGCELAANHKPFGFELQQTCFYFQLRQAERVGQTRDCSWSQAFEAAAKDFN